MPKIGSGTGKEVHMPRIKKIIAIRIKDVFMSFLLHLNEDLDDDLLSDAIGMMVSE